MLTPYLRFLKVVGVLSAFGLVAWLSYDYGVKSTQVSAQKMQDALYDKMEKKQDEAYVLAVKLAMQKPAVAIQYRTIEKEVIKYAQKNNDKQCVVNDADWLRLRADAVRAHNRAIGLQHPAPISDGAAQTAGRATGYERDAEILAEDVNNLKSCAENAKQLLQLQMWIKSQM
ncbi:MULTISPECIES: hypothetical protein [unclassified Vibrio]|uniref:hypothetical protein n=1 Tax=unclassified Vibrio TaxID=2614977 RepID=UPI001361EA4B|nr:MULTISPECIES: hypothetical protein [unclassified Vibrio]NAW58759.1 hypothetical protein [Vibrio sp. V36_P2S2PM302]NAX27192.1 hypothetical protein [Vibrio sp. V38_P2S17PM301]NAX32176.1 hypothetical protein [Vibrio sp. V37_P2S8PM304]